MSTGPVPPGFAWWLDLNVSHVYFLVQKKHGSPLAWLSPVVWVSSLLNVHYLDISPVILQPLFTSSVHDRLEVTLAVMVVFLIWSMVIISFVENDSHQPEFTCRF